MFEFGKETPKLMVKDLMADLEKEAGRLGEIITAMHRQKQEKVEESFPSYAYYPSSGGIFQLGQMQATAAQQYTYYQQLSTISNRSSV